MTAAIETCALTKRYGTRVAVQGLSLRVPEGALLGFLGPNGAGKTTTIRILVGLLRASAGSARLFGRDCWSDGPRLRAEVGYLPGELHLYETLTGRATLRFLAAVRRRDCSREIERLARVFDLDLDRRVRGYSHGMKQKLGLIQALMHGPRLLILDEPTGGLDPLMRRRLFDELRSVAAEGRTVLFSSHTLSEVDGLCDEVAVLRQGRLVEKERIGVLRARAPRRVELTIEADSHVPPPLPDALEPLERTPGRLSGRWTGPVRPLLDWLGTQPAIRDATIVPLDLEELFLGYYQSGPSPGRGDSTAEGPATDPPPPARDPEVPGLRNRPLIPGGAPAPVGRALVLKSFRDARVLVAAALIVVALFEVLFVLAMKNIAPEMIGFLRRFEFLRRLFQTLISFDLSAGASPTALVVLGLLHPFLSAVTWATLVTIGTRLPAGEIDRGTADLLLSLPVTRASVYVSASVVGLLTGLSLAAATWAGVALGTLLVPFPEPVDLTRIGIANVNQAALLLAISGTTALVSCLVNRRGLAVAIVVALLLTSFLANFLAAFLPLVEAVEFLGFLHYYRPVDAVRGGRWPVRDVCLLGAVAAVTWTAGLLVFRRKDVPVA
jgi:ABC-2 type transport system ATP-binding protein